MVGPGETPRAVFALEGLGAGVLAVVAGQFVGAGKAPGATLPGTAVRLFSCGGTVDN